MMRNLLLLLLALVGAWRAEAQLDPRVAKLEADMLIEGDFRRVCNTAEELSGYMEVIVNPTNRLSLYLFRSLSESLMVSSDQGTELRLEEVRELVAELHGMESRYGGLLSLAQALRQMERNSAEAEALSAEALRILRHACGAESREAAFAQMAYGQALIRNKKAAVATEQLTETIALLKRNKYDQPWLGSHSHATLAMAYVQQGTGDQAVVEVEKAINLVNELEQDVRMTAVALYPFGVVLYFYIAAGNYDDAIELGNVLRQQLEELYMVTGLDYGTLLFNIGAAYHYKQDLPKAKEFYHQAKQHYETYGFSNTEAYRKLITLLEQIP